MHPTIEEFEALVNWADGFPRPHWRRLWECYCGGVDGTDPEAELRVQRLWLAALREALGGDYRVDESIRLFLLREHPLPIAEQRLSKLERVLDTIVDALEGIGPPGGVLPGKLPVLYFTDADDYYSYIAEYYPSDGHFAGSGGICLRRDELHVAINGSEKISDVILVHELVHVCLSHLALPMWLEEGIVAIVEHVTVDQPSKDKTSVDELSRPLRDAQANFWGPIGLQSYWSGDAFHAPDDASPLSYELAEVMVRAIHAGRPDVFDAFVRRASPDDAGESAATEVLGKSLVAVVKHCIGDGPWLPPFPWNRPMPAIDQTAP